MYKDKKILVIIPARGGSKRLPGKNVKKIDGKPMIAHAIWAAKKSKYVDRTVVSTDDPAIIKTARKYEAEVPFVRPVELASDTASILPVLQHAVSCVENQNKFKPDLIVLIQPTSPLVKPEDIDGAIEKLISTKTNSCFTVSEISQRPEWMYHLEIKKPRPFLPSSNLTKRSQNLPKLGIINGAVYVTKCHTLMKKNLIIDNANTSIYLMPKERSADIDDLFDFKLAEFLFKYNKNKDE